MALGPRLLLNVGCGASPTPGWVNYDNSATVRIAGLPVFGRALGAAILPGRRDFVRTVREYGVSWADVTSRIPHIDGSVDAVYSSHMLEHLDPDAATRFLREVRRVLAPNGIIRLAVPDIEILVNLYLDTRDADAFIASTHLTRPAPRSLRAKLAWLAIGDRHHAWMYDERSLSAKLTSVGFIGARRVPAGSTTIPDPGALNLREREDESLYVEASTP